MVDMEGLAVLEAFSEVGVDRVLILQLEDLEQESQGMEALVAVVEDLLHPARLFLLKEVPVAMVVVVVVEVLARW